MGLLPGRALNLAIGKSRSERLQQVLPTMPLVHLSDRTLLRVTGPEAEHFLQNLITTDLGSLSQGEAKPGALLSPQGKILFDFLISRDGSEALVIDCRAEIAADLLKRLTIYKLRAKVDILLQEQELVSLSWQHESGLSQDDSTASASDSTWLVDTRFRDVKVFRRRGGGGPATASLEDWHRLRVQHAVAESEFDFQLGDAFPHDVLLDQNGGVGLRKGCYVGQEVVSRMQHRGTARRRLLIVRGEGPVPEPGTDVVAAGRPIGTIGTAVDNEGLAIMRIDRVKAAMDAGQPIEAGGIPLSISIPSWAQFTYPDTDGDASS